MAEENQHLKAYPEIADSDELLTMLATKVPEAGVTSPQQMRSLVSATSGKDPGLMKLSARSTNPEIAARLANEWAEMFVSWANSTYGYSTEEQLAFFEERLEDAAGELEAAEDALIEYQAQNRSLILENELLALQKNHADLLAKAGEINLLFQDIESLLALFQENSTSGNTTASSDQFTALLLKIRAFGGPPENSESSLPWQLQVSSDTLSANGGEDLEGQIRNLQTSLEIQSEQINASLAKIEPQLLAVQQEKQEANSREALLIRNTEVAQDAYTVLALAVEEKRITSQNTIAGVNLASRSAVPTSPTGPRKSTNALAVTVGVIILSIVVVILITWWSSTENSSLESNSEPDA
jgi:succinoglycan biosynthesis transport protein ExoP